MEKGLVGSVIAVVDDDQTFRFIFSMQVLQLNSNYKVLQFEDGYNVLEYLLENKDNTEALPDLIFLDLAMKRIDGWVFIEEFGNIQKFLKKSININILTGSMEVEDKIRASKNNLVSKYIKKPINDFDLKLLIQH